MRRYFIVASRIDELLRLPCLPFLRPKLARLSSFPIRLSSCATARSKHYHASCNTSWLADERNARPPSLSAASEQVGTDKRGHSYCPHAASNRLRDDSAAPSSVVFATSFTSCKILCPEPAST